MSPPLLVDVGHDGSPRRPTSPTARTCGRRAAEQAVDTLAVLDAARISAAENRTVDLLPAH